MWDAATRQPPGLAWHSRAARCWQDSAARTAGLPGAGRTVLRAQPLPVPAVRSIVPFRAAEAACAAVQWHRSTACHPWERRSQRPSMPGHLHTQAGIGTCASFRAGAAGGQGRQVQFARAARSLKGPQREGPRLMGWVQRAGPGELSMPCWCLVAGCARHVLPAGERRVDRAMLAMWLTLAVCS